MVTSVFVGHSTLLSDQGPHQSQHPVLLRRCQRVSGLLAGHQDASDSDFVAMHVCM